MYKKMMKRDIVRNKGVTCTLFAFIMLAAFLVSSAVNMVAELVGGMDALFEAAQAPHFVQMHSGVIDQKAVDTFGAENEWVSQWQTVQMLNVNGAYIYLGDSGLPESGSVMENSFVVQNEQFDFLLDTNNEIASIAPGEIGVPLYHMRQYGLEIGDTVTIRKGGFQKTFTIRSFIRDAQMNPSIVTSKRFLISQQDWDILYAYFDDIEYLIEFRLQDENLAHAFEGAYQNSGLPQQDTAITYSLYRLLNGLSDGIAAAVMVGSGILLIVIAALCLRFTMMAAMEEDYREIGVMKAIGLGHKEICWMYLCKYMAVAAVGCICGYLLSIMAGGLFTQNISRYMGRGPVSLISRLFPGIAAGLVFVAVTLYCRKVLNRFKVVSAVEAIRSGKAGGKSYGGKLLKLHRSNFPDINIFLGFKEVVNRFQAYALLCFVFAVCSFLLIVPVNFQNTIASPEFISYMGAGKSHIRIDFQQLGSTNGEYENMLALIDQDPDVARYGAFVTGVFQVQNSDGLYDNIKVESGDFTVFPLLYQNGRAPEKETEIALSVLNAAELGKQVGDKVILLVQGEEMPLTVSGIYQDVTNGGKTAKAQLAIGGENVLWSVVNLDLKEGVAAGDKTAAYTALFYPAKVTDMGGYVAQTMGSILDQLNLMVKLAFVLAVVVAALITAMFFRMLLAKDSTQIAIMRSLGFSLHDIRLQYITRALIVLAAGLFLGTLGSSILGEQFAGLLLSGVSGLQFIVNPWISYVLCPLAFMIIVTATIYICSITVKMAGVLAITAD